MFGSGKNFAFRFGDIFLAARYDKYWLFSAYWSLYVGIGLSTQSLDLTAWNKEKKLLEDIFVKKY